MKKLKQSEKVRGTGYPRTKAIKIKRKGNICLYKITSHEGLPEESTQYEVFIPKIKNQTKWPKGNISPKIKNQTKWPKGNILPKREFYPSNEDFGKTAFCYSNIILAEQKFKELLQNRKEGEPKAHNRH